MQRLHRSTVWRRKQRPPSGRGRKRAGHRDDRYNLRVVAKMLSYAYRAAGASGFDRGRVFVSMKDALALPVDDRVGGVLMMESLLKEMRKTPQGDLPVGVVIVAAWRALQPDARTRGLSGDKRKALAVRQVMESGMTRAEAEKLVTRAMKRGEEWVSLFAQDNADKPTGFTNTSDNLPCPSRYFRISRRMVSYWRQSDTRDVEMAIESIATPQMLLVKAGLRR
jgi:hypothetical protein